MWKYCIRRSDRNFRSDHQQLPWNLRLHKTKTKKRNKFEEREWTWNIEEWEEKRMRRREKGLKEHPTLWKCYKDQELLFPTRLTNNKLKNSLKCKTKRICIWEIITTKVFDEINGSGGITQTTSNLKDEITWDFHHSQQIEVRSFLHEILNFSLHSFPIFHFQMVIFLFQLVIVLLQLVIVLVQLVIVLFQLVIVLFQLDFIS